MRFPYHCRSLDGFRWHARQADKPEPKEDAPTIDATFDDLRTHCRMVTSQNEPPLAKDYSCDLLSMWSQQQAQSDPGSDGAQTHLSTMGHQIESGLLLTLDQLQSSELDDGSFWADCTHIETSVQSATQWTRICLLQVCTLLLCTRYTLLLAQKISVPNYTRSKRGWLSCFYSA